MINSRIHAGYRPPTPRPCIKGPAQPRLDPDWDTCTPGNLTWPVGAQLVVVLVMGKLPTRPPVFPVPGCLEVPSLSAPLTSGLVLSVLYLGRPVCLLSD